MDNNYLQHIATSDSVLDTSSKLVIPEGMRTAMPSTWEGNVQRSLLTEEVREGERARVRFV